jgi:glycosyltransferase involved in cell wall biosynthesis
MRTRIPLVVSRRVDFHLSSNPLTRWKYSRASRIIAVSAAIKNVLVEDGVPAGKIAVVRSGVDLNRAQAEPGRRQELGLPGSGPLIGQIAALAPHKDPFNFLRAMVLVRQRYREAHAVMLGDGPLREDVKRELARLDLGKTVLLLGFREDAPRILRHLDVFVLSSYLEGLGTSILDAMAAGVPVVATKTGGIPEMVDHQVSGLLVPPRDPRSLADAICAVLGDRNLGDRLKQGGLKTVERFKSDAMVEATRSIYEEVLRETKQWT